MSDLSWSTVIFQHSPRANCGRVDMSNVRTVLWGVRRFRLLTCTQGRVLGWQTPSVSLYIDLTLDALKMSLCGEHRRDGADLTGARSPF